MDSDHRGYGRGGGRRGRGYNRARGRYRNHHNSNYYNSNNEDYNQDSSQKDESYQHEEYEQNYRPRGRGYRQSRGSYRGAPRTARGRGRRGGHYQQYPSEHQEEPKQQEEQEDVDEFGFNPKKNYGYGSKPKEVGEQYKPKRGRPYTAAAPRHDGDREIPKMPPKISGDPSQLPKMNLPTKLYNQAPAGGPPIRYVLDEEEKIYYKAEDFIVKYDNLPEKTEYLVRGLCEGSISCSICHNDIAQAGAVWNCKQCYQPLHLGCIKRWINKVNADGPMEFNQYEENKVEYNVDGREVQDGNINVVKDKDGNILMKQTN